MSHENVIKCLENVKNGELCVVADSENRENEGDFIMAADKITPEKFTFILHHSTGLICVAILQERADELGIPSMMEHSEEPFGLRFMVPVDYKPGLTTGVSAMERSHTIRALADPKNKKEDFIKPGHVFPLLAEPNGVLDRDGHTEAAMEMARLAGCYPAGVLVEIMSWDGKMLRRPQLKKFCAYYDLPYCTIDEIKNYRKDTEKDTLKKVG